MTVLDTLIQLIFGLPTDPVLQIIIYIGAIQISVVLMAGIFRLFHTIGKMISG